MHLWITVLLIILSILLIACLTEHNIHSNRITARSPVRNAQTGAEIVESGHAFHFQGQEGVVLLQGVGERLKANQMMERQNSQKIAKDMNAAFVRYCKAVENHRGKVLLKDMVARQEQVESLWAYQNAVERRKHVDNVVKNIGGYIKIIGPVNKEMQKRMMKHFQPLPNPVPKARAAYRKVQVARRKEERARKKEETQLKKEAKAHKREVRAQKKQKLS